LGKRFSPISTSFSIVSSRAFRDAPHSRFWCRDLKLCLLDVLKILDLALSQIYTRVFQLWKSVALDYAWGKDSRPFISFFSLTCFLELVYGPWDSEISPKFLEIDPKLVKITLRVFQSRRLSSHQVAIFRPDSS